MNKCPFWSTVKEPFECYEECPIMEERIHGQEEQEACVFKEHLSIDRSNFRDLMREEYDFFNISLYN